MSAAELAVLAPFAILGLAPVAVLVSIGLLRSHAAAAILALGGMAGAATALAFAARFLPLRVGELLLVDGFGLWFVALVLAAAAAVVLLAFGSFQGDGEGEELYALVGLATAGAAIVVVSAHFVALFLGIELVSISLYPLIAYRKDRRGIEAGFKYLVLAAAASAVMLFGMALVYAELGTMSFRDLALLSLWRGADAGMLGPGLALIAVGIGFKLALAPFHTWSPDVYQGASAPVAGFIATVSKGAVVAAAARLFVPLLLAGSRTLPVALALLAIASIVAGNFLALGQTSVRRLLAYSSIAHLGYMLIAILASGARAMIALGFYAATYVAASLAAFAALSILPAPARPGEPAGRDADALADLSGLAWRRPLVAAVLGLGMLSLAGIPFTAGFMGKVALVAAGLDANRTALVLLLAFGSAVGIYYYLRVIAVLCAEPAAAPAPPPAAVPATAVFVLTALAVAILWLGVHPWSLERILVAALARR